MGNKDKCNWWDIWLFTRPHSNVFIERWQLASLIWCMHTIHRAGWCLKNRLTDKHLKIMPCSRRICNGGKTAYQLTFRNKVMLQSTFKMAIYCMWQRELTVTPFCCVKASQWACGAEAVPITKRTVESGPLWFKGCSLILVYLSNAKMESLSCDTKMWNSIDR